jgi:hypothetical protein
MMALADAFLIGAAALGFSSKEAVDLLNARCLEMKGAQPNG